MQNPKSTKMYQKDAVGRPGEGVPDEINAAFPLATFLDTSSQPLHKKL